MKFNLLTDKIENEVTLYLQRGAIDEGVVYLWAKSEREDSESLLMTFNEDGSVSLVKDCSGALRSLGFEVEGVDGTDKLLVK